jgi:hypothetical protein
MQSSIYSATKGRQESAWGKFHEETYQKVNDTVRVVRLQFTIVFFFPYMFYNSINDHTSV